MKSSDGEVGRPSGRGLFLGREPAGRAKILFQTLYRLLLYLRLVIIGAECCVYDVEVVLIDESL